MRAALHGACSKIIEGKVHLPVLPPTLLVLEVTCTRQLYAEPTFKTPAGTNNDWVVPVVGGKV